ncbi:rhamnan synthesis protein F [mine drainage metagenome]|jgi:lipopolysaccharide biosynthesis protein|uniref:Rhamnan synthesis protein F n=1 Tax=mine drainage metagenome TaxID=410659 RepID=A0A1J5R323_9ZZZZ
MGNGGEVNGHAQGSCAFAILVHAFYEDVWQSIADRIATIKTPVDLYVTVPESGEFDTIAAVIVMRFPAAHVLRVPNRGRDVAPFLTAMEAFDLYRYDTVLKLHTKRSRHLLHDGARWANDLFRSLIGDEATVDAALRIFRQFPAIGMIYPNFVKTPISTELIPNLKWLDLLLPRIGREQRDVAGWEFAAGTMFWFRGAAMKPLRELRITIDDFEPENGQINGTLAHALERIFPQLIYRSGQLIVTADGIAEVPPSALARVIAGVQRAPQPIRKGFRTPPKRGASRR